MKKYFLVFLMVVSFSTRETSAQGPFIKQWDNRFGGTLLDWFTTCIETSDSGYIIAGHSNSQGTGDKSQSNCDVTLNTFDYWILKTDSARNVLWNKRFGGWDEDELSEIIEVSDGYILAGTTQSGPTCDKTALRKGSTDYWVVKSDLAGNRIWDMGFGGSMLNKLTCALKLVNNGILLGGYSSSGISGDKSQPNWDTLQGTSDFWIIKTDSAGNKIWDKRYGGTKDDMLSSMEQTSDGGFILGGTSFSDISGDITQANWDANLMFGDYWIIRIDSTGNRLWEKRFGGLHGETLSCIRQTDDGGYILLGSSQSDNTGNKTQPNWDATLSTTDFWIVKTDAFGNKLWDKRFGGTSSEFDGRTILFTSDGGYMFAGISVSDSSGDHSEATIWGLHCWVIKTDVVGNKLWDKLIRVSGGSEKSMGLITRDNCYILGMQVNAGIGGEKSQPSQGGDDYWIIKYCDSTITTGVALDEKQSLLIYPNPTEGKFAIVNGQFAITSIELFDILGKKVVSLNSFSIDADPSSKKYEVDISDLSPGIYFLKIQTEKYNYSQKILRQ